MQEQQATQIQTPQTPLQSLFSSSTTQANIFEKYRDSNALKFSAFKLVKSSSSDQDSDSDTPESSNPYTRNRSKRGNYRKYTIEEKQEAVRKIMSGYDVKEISKQYQIPRRNLLRWKKNGCQRKEGGGRPTDGELENVLYTKIMNKDLRGEKQIREQAKKLSKSESFKASKGWYCKFNKRFTNFNSKFNRVKQSVQSQNNEDGQYQNM